MQYSCSRFDLLLSLISYELREYLSFSRKIFRGNENMSSYVTFNEESSQTMAEISTDIAYCFNS